MFNRSSNFRSSYEFFKRVKQSFHCVLMMALSATFGQEQLHSLCVEYLKNPVLIKGSINCSNIKLNIKPYVQAKKSKRDSQGSGNSKEGIWSACALQIKNITADNCIIVYMDFRSDVELMTSSLKLQIRNDVRSYYGKGMTHDAKKKTDTDFRSKEFLVLAATEAYEV